MPSSTLHFPRDQLLEDADRPIMIEVSEHARIDDYNAFRQAVDRLPGVSLAVNDAGQAMRA